MCPESPVTVPVAATRLDQSFCRNDLERRFLERLDHRASCAGWYADSWSHTAEHVIINISLVRGESVYRDLRADFFGDRLLLGCDETHQFVAPLDLERPGVIEIILPTAEAMADAAADWFEQEMAKEQFTNPT